MNTKVLYGQHHQWTMNRFAELRSRSGHATQVGYDFCASFDRLTERGEADFFIVATEDGFSPLGASRAFFAHELGIEESRISEVANWNRFENPEVSLVILPPQTTCSKLRGVVLAASETSRCYETFAVHRDGKPCRDFYYNVAYEAIAHANGSMGATRLAMSHLSRSSGFHEDIATCVAEALAHYVDGKAKPRIDSFAFVGCCIEPHHLEGIRRLNPEGKQTRHRPMQTRVTRQDGFDVITLELKRGV